MGKINDPFPPPPPWLREWRKERQVSNGDRIMVSRGELAALREQKTKADNLNRVLKQELNDLRSLSERCADALEGSTARAGVAQRNFVTMTFVAFAFFVSALALLLTR